MSAILFNPTTGIYYLNPLYVDKYCFDFNEELELILLVASLNDADTD